MSLGVCLHRSKGPCRNSQWPVVMASGLELAPPRGLDAGVPSRCIRNVSTLSSGYHLHKPPNRFPSVISEIVAVMGSWSCSSLVGLNSGLHLAVPLLARYIDSSAGLGLARIMQKNRAPFPEKRVPCEPCSPKFQRHFRHFRLLNFGYPGTAIRMGASCLSDGFDIFSKWFRSVFHVGTPRVLFSARYSCVLIPQSRM
jgi:hypothetical protein